MASTSTSAASVHKQSVSSSSCSRKTDTERRRSCDTVCSSNSSCFLQKRKTIHPLAASLKIQGTKNPNNIVKQRVLSAKLLKLKSVQSQLNDANFHLAELMKENRALRTLQKRQDKALKNYEGVNADLPRLIKCHEDEMRVLQEKNKLLRRSLREAQEHVKFKDEEINSIRSQLRHLSVLTKDKHLGEREQLKEELEEIKEKMKQSENQISLLNRRLMLEMKNSKYKLNNEIAKHKQCQKELSQAMIELHRCGGNINELNDGKILKNRKRSNLPQRQSMSCVSLGSGSSPELTNDRLVAESSPDIKLEPISNKQEDSQDITNEIIKNPADNIKARLSSANLKNGKSEQNSSDVLNGILKHPSENGKSRYSASKLTNSQLEADRINTMKKISNEENNEKNLNKTQPPKSIYTVASHNSISRSNSSHKLDAITDNLQTSLQRSSSNDVDKRLGDYCLNVVNSVKTMNNVVDKHKENFDTTKTETQKLLQQLKLADMADAKLRQNKLVEEFKVPKEDIDIVNRIWFEEYSFQESKKRNSLPKDMKSIDKNGNVAVDSDTVSEDRKSKLLATLRAIDNGEVVENLDETVNRKTKVMKEIFGESDR